MHMLFLLLLIHANRYAEVYLHAVCQFGIKHEFCKDNQRTNEYRHLCSGSEKSTQWFSCRAFAGSREVVRNGTMCRLCVLGKLSTRTVLLQPHSHLAPSPLWSPTSPSCWAFKVTRTHRRSLSSEIWVCAQERERAHWSCVSVCAADRSHL